MEVLKITTLGVVMLPTATNITVTTAKAFYNGITKVTKIKLWWSLASYNVQLTLSRLATVSSTFLTAEL